MIKEAALLIFLIIGSLEDIVKKQIHLIWVVLFSIAGCVFSYYEGRTIWQMLAGAGVGVLLYAASVLSDEKIGKGDAYVLMATGMYLGFWNNVALLWMASVGIGIYSLGLYAICKRGKNHRIAFIPFLLAAYLIM